MFFFPLFNFTILLFPQPSKEASSSCCGGNKENKDKNESNIVLDGNNKLGLEGDEDEEIEEEEEEEEDKINNEYVLYDEASDGEYGEEAEGGENYFHTFY